MAMQASSLSLKLPPLVGHQRERWSDRGRQGNGEGEGQGGTGRVTGGGTVARKLVDPDPPWHGVENTGTSKAD